MKPCFSFLVIVSGIFFLSCKKNSSSGSSRQNPVQTDTLAAGWQKVNTGLSTFINDIWFLDASKGLMVVGNGIYSSLDGGKTWNLKTSSFRNYFNLFFANNLVGFAQKRDSIAITKDGGNTWESKKLPRTDVLDIHFISPSIGFAFGSGGTYKTTDTAKTWTEVTKNASTNSLYFINQSLGFMQQADGYIYSSVDVGSTWQKRSLTNVPMGIIDYMFFYDQNTGWLVNGSYGLFKTVNGGIDWAHVPSVLSPGSGLASDCFFANANEGFICFSKKVRSTNNGGSNWNDEVKMHTQTIGEFYFIDKNTGWVGCSNGILLLYKK